MSRLNDHVEIFQHPEDYNLNEDSQEENRYESGWYYWYCFPGCLPDSEPYGPYESEEEIMEEIGEEELEIESEKLLEENEPPGVIEMILNELRGWEVAINKEDDSIIYRDTLIRTDQDIFKVGNKVFNSDDVVSVSVSQEVRPLIILITWEEQ